MTYYIGNWDAYYVADIMEINFYKPNIIFHPLLKVVSKNECILNYFLLNILGLLLLELEIQV